MNLNDGSIDESHLPLDFAKIKLGIKTLDDAILTLGDYKRINPRLGDKNEVLKAINSYDVEKMRDISNFFFRTSGIYSRLCRYMAYLYRYDWFITPFINECEDLIQEQDSDIYTSSLELKQKKKIFSNFFQVLRFFERSSIKKWCGQVALKVIRKGCYYGYITAQNSSFVIQELEPLYCRSRFKIDNRPVVEFYMKYFDDMFPDEELRTKMLNFFPEDFKKGYKLYKERKLKPLFNGDVPGWYVLNPKSAIKFNMNEEDFPAFISVIPAIIDLDDAKDLDKKKMAQRLLKIIIQKMPIDKNGDLIFDVDEAQELHNNAVKMLSRAIGIDVLTTFADVEVADMADKSNTTATDELEKVERAVFNEAGVSQLQFNSDGNIALTNSILNDEASMYNLLVQFESFLNLMLEPFNKSPKKCYYRAEILTTTIYNYKDMAKLYKEQAQMGYSKMLPQVALGQSQSTILANAYFENDILDLVRVFVPPLTSNTMNAEALQNRGNTSGKENGNGNGNGQAGRPEKEDSEKAEKTIANKESM